MNTVVTVYGVDIDTASKVECVPVSYQVVPMDNSQICYTFLLNVLKSFNIIKEAEIVGTAIAAIVGGVFHLEAPLSIDEIMVLEVPLSNTQLKTYDFTLGLSKAGTVVFDDVARQDVSTKLRVTLQDEYQRYLNKMMELKSIGSIT